MPQLIRLYITQVAFGFGVSAAFVFALVALDIAGIGHLVMGSDMGLVAALMLWVFHGVVMRVWLSRSLLASAQPSAGRFIKDPQYVSTLV